MATEKPEWVMPEWMEPYRGCIVNTGGNSIESLMNDTSTNMFNNALRSALIVAVQSQILLLWDLHHKNLLETLEGGQ